MYFLVTLEYECCGLFPRFRFRINFTHTLFILVTLVDDEAESYDQKKSAVTIQELNDDQRFEMDETNCANENTTNDNDANYTTNESPVDIPITACARPDPR